MTPRQILAKIASELDVTRYLSHREFLRELYARAKIQIADYSYLRFAEDLGFSATNVIRLIIVGQRTLSTKAAEKIAIQLKMRGGSRRYWTHLVKYINARLPAERDRHFRLMMSYRNQTQPQKLDTHQLQYYSQWYNPVIRELVALPDFDGSPEWIQACLNFPMRREEIVEALNLLIEIGEIAKDPTTGSYQKLKKSIMTASEIDDLAIVRYHQKMIEIGKESITRIDEMDRDIRALTVRLPMDKIPELKTKIDGWLQEILGMEPSSADADDSIYQMNIQLFPFTKRKKS